jgi:hypothetical protein
MTTAERVISCAAEGREASVAAPPVRSGEGYRELDWLASAG